MSPLLWTVSFESPVLIALMNMYIFDATDGRARLIMQDHVSSEERHER